MISIWLDKLKLTDEDANVWEIKSQALALLLVLLLPCKNAKYNGTIYRCLSPIVDLAQIFSISMVKYFHVCKLGQYLTFHAFSIRKYYMYWSPRKCHKLASARIDIRPSRKGHTSFNSGRIYFNMCIIDAPPTKFSIIICKHLPIPNTLSAIHDEK